MPRKPRWAPSRARRGNGHSSGRASNLNSGCERTCFFPILEASQRVQVQVHGIVNANRLQQGLFAPMPGDRRARPARFDLDLHISVGQVFHMSKKPENIGHTIEVQPAQEK